MELHKRSLTPMQAVGVVCLLVVAGWALFAAYSAIARVREDRAAQSRIPRVLAELRSHREHLARLINAYHEQFGFFPPNRATNREMGAKVNPLYYELIGTRWNPERKVFNVPSTKEPITPETLMEKFNIGAFSNTLVYPNWPTNFLLLTPFVGYQTDAGIIGLGYFGDEVPEALADRFKFTTWRYAADPPLHNKDGFDIWIEMTVRGKEFVIGNWRETE